jgi:hypothetical protein
VNIIHCHGSSPCLVAAPAAACVFENPPRHAALGEHLYLCIRVRMAHAAGPAPTPTAKAATATSVGVTRLYQTGAKRRATPTDAQARAGGEKVCPLLPVSAGCGHRNLFLTAENFSDGG